MLTAIDRKNAPAISVVDKIFIQQAEKNILDNGIPVYSINAGFQDLVKVELLFNNKKFDVSHPLNDSATNRMLQEGTKHYSARELADRIDYYGAFFETDENYDFCSVMLYTLNKHLKSTLPFVYEMITEPVFPEAELDVYKQNYKQRLTVENEKVNSLARRNFNQIIFGNNHPYGYFNQLSDYDRLKRDELVEYHRRKYSPSNCTIIISGLIKENTIALVNEIFGKMPTVNNNGQAAAQLGFESKPEKKHFIEKEGAIQSAIRIGKPFFNRSHPDYPLMAVVNTILGGYFGSRLMSNIREDKGYTYGIGSTIVSMKQEGYFFISTEVGKDVTTAAVNEIYKEVELMKEEVVDSEELEVVRNYMLGTFLKGIDGAFHLAERFKSIYLSGLDYSYYDRYLEKIRNVSSDEIREAARKYFDLPSFYEVVVGSK